MRVLGSLIGFTWIAFIVVWFVSSWFAKRAMYWSRGFWLVRVAIIVVLIFGIRGGEHGANSFPRQTGNFTLGVIGVVLCMGGIAIAFWARFFIGRNWGMPMTRKAEPELVTSGPYRYVRHPIYSGVLLAMLGTALVMGWPWFVLLALMGVYFTLSARTEEKYLTAQFPDAYPAYRARSRMLIPFVL